MNERPANPALRWHASWLFTAPHRLCFFAGALMMASTSLWWCTTLILRTFQFRATWAIPPAAAHGLLMSVGFMPFFFAGFIFTAVPKWLRQPPVSARSLALPLAAMLAGWIAVYVGVQMRASVAGVGLVLVASGWSGICLRLFGLIHRSRVTDRLHTLLLATACGTGAATLWLAAAALLLGDDLLLQAAVDLALWCFVAPVFAVVSHRTLPIYGSTPLQTLDQRHPTWLLWPTAGLLWFQGPFTAMQLFGPVPDAALWVVAALQAGAAALLLWLAVRWAQVRNMKIRLLAMLHTAFVWLGLCMALAAVSHALMAATAGRGSLGLAPLHAMAMGYLGTTLLAVVTRLTSAHSGHPHPVDNTLWRLYKLLQLAVVLRVLGALWPAAASSLILAAVLVWALVTVWWAIRYGRWLGLPRADGRPG
ncbi:MAG: NnrS family protein [Proteobacteria bacterium]|nr:NnrS family protein [Pseudomonadota bacterium]